MHVRVLAPPFEACKKCGEMNRGDRGHLWRVANERGTFLECDICAHSEKYVDNKS